MIDEIGTEAECIAARTIAQRGVQLVATAHGNELQNVLKNPSLADLVSLVTSPFPVQRGAAGHVVVCVLPRTFILSKRKTVQPSRRLEQGVVYVSRLPLCVGWMDGEEWGLPGVHNLAPDTCWAFTGASRFSLEACWSRVHTSWARLPASVASRHETV